MNIEIRRAEPSDANALHRLFSAPLVIAGDLQLPYPSLEQRRKRLSEPPEGTYRLVACVEDEVVGQASLWTNHRLPRRSHAAAIGIAVRDDWHNKGVGTALMEAIVDLADNWLGLTRLELGVFTDNEAAIHLYKKFGFEVEGIQRKFALRDGAFVDALMMARLRG